jgi:hypothetical protein
MEALFRCYIMWNVYVYTTNALYNSLHALLCFSFILSLVIYIEKFTEIIRELTLYKEIKL